MRDAEVTEGVVDTGVLLRLLAKLPVPMPRLAYRCWRDTLEPTAAVGMPMPRLPMAGTIEEIWRGPVGHTYTRRKTSKDSSQLEAEMDHALLT